MGHFTIAKPTHEQLAIRDEFIHGRKPFMVVARAGVGKTTMSFDGIEHCPEVQRGWVLYLAFNKKIEIAAKEKNGVIVVRGKDVGTPLIPRLEIKTIHSTGLRFIRTRWRDCGISFEGERADALTASVCGATVPEDVARLVTKLHTKAREINPMARAVGDLTDLALQFECEPDEEHQIKGFNLDYVEARALEAMELAAMKEPSIIDGADMIFLPIRNGWLRPTWDFALVDETQDMTPAQLLIAKGIGKGRLGLVGDDRQAIYQFRGAGVGTMSRLQQELQAKTYPMTVTFRCGKKIVELAQNFVPDLQAADSNPDGEVLEGSVEQMLQMAAPGDYVLSRLNAPLMPIAMSFLKAGKRAKINGTDIGQSLVKLARKLMRRGDESVENFITRIMLWRDNQVSRLIAAKRPQRYIDFVNDKAEMIIDLCEDMGSVSAVISRLETLFIDAGQGDTGVILCSSVHKAKGLETDRVFVLRDSLRSHTEEELNIQYVAFTRAKTTLMLVSGGV